MLTLQYITSKTPFAERRQHDNSKTDWHTQQHNPFTWRQKPPSWESCWAEKEEELKGWVNVNSDTRGAWIWWSGVT